MSVFAETAKNEIIDEIFTEDQEVIKEIKNIEKEIISNIPKQNTNEESIPETIDNNEESILETLYNNAEPIIETLYNNAEPIIETLYNNAEPIIETIDNIIFQNRSYVREGWSGFNYTHQISSNNAQIVVTNSTDYEVRIVSSNREEWKIVAIGNIPSEGLQFIIYYQTSEGGRSAIYKAIVIITGESSAPIREGLTGTGSHSINGVRISQYIISGDDGNETTVTPPITEPNGTNNETNNGTNNETNNGNNNETNNGTNNETNNDTDNIITLPPIDDGDTIIIDNDTDNIITLPPIDDGDTISIIPPEYNNNDYENISGLTPPQHGDTDNKTMVAVKPNNTISVYTINESENKAKMIYMQETGVPVFFGILSIILIMIIAMTNTIFKKK